MLRRGMNVSPPGVPAYPNKRMRGSVAQHGTWAAVCRRGRAHFHWHPLLVNRASEVRDGDRMETSPRKVEGLSENEVLDLCRSEVETMHNVHYLMSRPDVPRDTLQRYLADLSRSLEHLTDILCRSNNKS
jgi:hypothetical protein